MVRREGSERRTERERERVDCKSMDHSHGQEHKGQSPLNPPPFSLSPVLNPLPLRLLLHPCFLNLIFLMHSLLSLLPFFLFVILPRGQTPFNSLKNIIEVETGCSLMQKPIMCIRLKIHDFSNKLLNSTDVLIPHFSMKFTKLINLNKAIFYILIIHFIIKFNIVYNFE
jgi:hypothetical protein